MLKSTIYLLHTISILSIIYFLLITVFSGIHTSFLWIWPFLSACCLAFSRFLSYAGRQTEKPWPLCRTLAIILFWCGFSFLFIIECHIIREGNARPENGSSYLIVLGAQVRGDTPSLTLQARINTAAQYLKENPDCIAICSGGQGPSENISEAQAIRDGLIALGISEDRLIMEALSTNTVENLNFCKEIIADPSASVVIVTSNFHCCRAGLIAKKYSYQNYATLSANEFFYTTPHYYFREFFALMKDFLFKNI